LEFTIRDGSIGGAPATAPAMTDSSVTKQLDMLRNDVRNISTVFAEYGKDSKAMKVDIQALATAQSAQEKTQKEVLNCTVQSLQEQIAGLLKATEETKELLKIPPPAASTTRNILISTPALTAAVAALPPAMDLDDDSDSENVQGQLSADVEMSVEDEAEGEEDDSPELQQVMIKGKQYFMDAENSIYVETDEGYEEIGKYNPTLDCIEGTEEEEEEAEEAEEEEAEEEEEAVEVEEFIYKGKTYQRDNENNVYEDGDHIGTWNGKKIVPLA
jgi:hypothetical protein